VVLINQLEDPLKLASEEAETYPKEEKEVMRDLLQSKEQEILDHY
jgi:hypothetical protein